jgi:iron complex transport system substrate-binding protein
MAKRLLFIWLLLVAFTPNSYGAEPRIVSLGGSVSEIVFALGKGNRIVGVDTSSTFPEAATKLPKVGYQRTLAAEGVLSLRPTLILATTDAGPPPAMAQLQSSGVKTVILPGETTVAAAEARIRGFAKVLDATRQGENLIATLKKDLLAAKTLLQGTRTKPKVLFLYARGGGTLLVAGRNNAADSMIALAGGANTIFGYEGYKPLTAEAVVTAAPEIILIPKAGLESIDGIDGLLKLPGIALTPAGKNRRIVALDDLYLLGFGPRLGKAVQDLERLFHPELRR